MAAAGSARCRATTTAAEYAGALRGPSVSVSSKKSAPLLAGPVSLLLLTSGLLLRGLFLLSHSNPLSVSAIPSTDAPIPSTDSAKRVLRSSQENVGRREFPLSHGGQLRRGAAAHTGDCNCVALPQVGKNGIVPRRFSVPVKAPREASRTKWIASRTDDPRDSRAASRPCGHDVCPRPRAARSPGCSRPSRYRRRSECPGP